MQIVVDKIILTLRLASSNESHKTHTDCMLEYAAKVPQDFELLGYYAKTAKIAVKD